MKVNHRHPFNTPLLLIALPALLLAFSIPATHALKPGEVSYSAEMATAIRAIAAMDPDEKVRNPDYLAGKFLTPNFWFFGPWRKDYQKSREFVKFYRVSGYYTLNAATHHIDGILKDISKKNLTQVVIIGAGFNSCAYRFGKHMPEVRFFELDQPATLNRKKEMINTILGKIPENVTYIPIDYRTHPFFDALKQAGYDEKQKTLFIWEGVSQFMDKKVVDQTLDFIAGQCASGSEVVFDYIFNEVVQGDYSKYRGARFVSLRMETKGEPWKFGIAEGKAEEFVTHHGLEIISELGPKELSQKYLVRSDGTIDGTPTPFIHIIHAKVAR